MLGYIKVFVWTIAIIFLLFGGLIFSFKLKFPQFKFSGFLNKSSLNNGNITPFKTLMLSLGGRIGVGSLAGIALALFLGGPGTIFWIWVITIITSVNTYVESLLAFKYKSQYKKGPVSYIEKGLNNKKLALVYSILIIISYIFGFMTIQSNTIVSSVKSISNINPIVISLVIVIITYISINKDVNKICNILSYIVPIMSFIFIIISLKIIIVNFKYIPECFKLIFKSAFKKESFITSLFIGIERGVFATESGLGSGAIASSITDSKDYKNNSLLQTLGIYFITFIICTSTAIIILLSNYSNMVFNNINGIEIVFYTFDFHLGNMGTYILIVLIIFFAFSTILTGYFYGLTSLNNILKSDTSIHKYVLKYVSIMLLFIGGLIKASFIWYIVDICVALLAIINMYSLIKLRNKVNVI